MTVTRTPSSRHPGRRLNTVIVLLSVVVSLAHGYPLNGQTELDSAVEGVQKYLESSGFPKMTRGEVLDFLNDFSKNSRVSRSDNSAAVKKDITSYVTLQPDVAYSKTQTPHANDGEVTTSRAAARPKIPEGESPLNYGYPMSMNKPKTAEPLPPSTTPMIFVTVQRDGNFTRDKKALELQEIALRPMLDGRNAAKKNIGPSVDLNAYAKFKKIPEARNLKIDDDMKDFLNNFGLLDGPAPRPVIKPIGPNDGESLRRRNDDATVTETVDEKLLKSLLIETGQSGGGSAANVSLQLQPLLEIASARGDHVFNPSDSDVKTVDVNRIAKIVENIRLLANDNNTVSLSQEAIQKKLENITAAIAAIDQPAAAAAAAPTDNYLNNDNKGFNGYEVFFDDDSKEVDSDLPEGPAADTAAQQPLNKVNNPPDPLSTDELQMLLEKNKNDVKRQEPVEDAPKTSVTTAAATSTEGSTVVATSSEAVAVTSASADSSSEATSAVEVTSGASAARDASTTAVADTNPSLSQLAESFGGGETASNPPEVDEMITPGPDRPKNGLYFYVDWNSFLTVNGGQKNQVNLRFAPKAGNPNHFIKVNVP